MTRVSLFGRLAALVGVLLLMASATAALALPIEPGAATPAAPAAPAANTLSVSTSPVWNGHNCTATVSINIDSVEGTAGLGGFETRLNFPDGRFDVTDTISTDIVSEYLASTGRNTSGDDSTPPLEKVETSGATTDSVKFGDYSWADTEINGPTGAGMLASVGMKPTATCGLAALELTETQLVDPDGTVIAHTISGTASIKINSKFDINGNNFIQSNDAFAIVNKYNAADARNCGANYLYDVNGNGFIQSNDAFAVVNRYNAPVTGTACTQ